MKLKLELPSKKILAAAGVLVLAALFMVVGSTLLDSKEEKPAAQLGPIKADKRVLAEGYLTPVKASGLNFATTGIVSRLLVSEGDQVQQGKLLAQVDDRELRAQYEQAQAALEKNKANLTMTQGGSRQQEIKLKEGQLAAAQADYDLAAKEYERKKQLFQQQALSQQEMDEATANLQNNEAQLKQAQAQLELVKAGSRQEVIAMARADLAAAQANVSLYKSQLDRTELRAPFSGTVMFINFNVGEYVVTGSTNLLDAGVSTNTTVQLADLSKWRVKTDDLTELDIIKVKPGASATVKFDAIPGLEMKGKVVKVGSFGEKKQGDMTYTVTIDLAGNDDRLRWNMRASVAIEGDEK